MRRAGKEGLLAVVVSLLVVAAVVRGLVMIGPIDEQRDRKFDERRLSDIQRIAASVEFYYRDHHELPGSLAVLATLPGAKLPLADPQTGKAYGYHRLSADTYELCATFALQSGESTPLRWAHKAGQACFRLNVRR